MCMHKIISVHRSICLSIYIYIYLTLSTYPYHEWEPCLALLECLELLRDWLADMAEHMHAYIHIYICIYLSRSTYIDRYL